MTRPTKAASPGANDRIRTLITGGAGSLQQIATALGISRQAVHRRITKMPDAQALRAHLERNKDAGRPDTSAPKPREQFEMFGECKTLHAWARDPRCTVAYDALLRRMRAGTWDLQAAMTAPLDKSAGQRAAVAATIRAGERRRERIRELIAAGAPSARAIATQLGITASSVGYHIRLMPDSAQLQAQMDANRRRRRPQAPAEAAKQRPRPQVQAEPGERRGRPVLEAFGERKMISEWARDPRCAVKFVTLIHRMRSGKWTLEDALTTRADPRSGPRAGAEAGKVKGERTRERIRELVADGAPSVKALAEELGASISAVHHHIAVMPDGQEMLARMRAGRTPTVAAFGETKTPGQWARDPRCAVSPNTFRRRLAEGWRPEDAITTPGWLPNPATPTIRKES